MCLSFVSLQSLHLLRVLCHDLQRRQHRWRGPDETPAPLLTGVEWLAAWPVPPNTGCEPNFCAHINEEHTPINLPDSNRNFPRRDDATIISTTEDPEVFQHSGAAISSKHAAASRVPTVLGSSGNSFWKQMAVYESVDSRDGIQETGANLERESVVSTLFRSQSKGKRDRDQNVVHSLRDRENLHKILERKVDLAVRGATMAQQQLFLKLRHKLGRGIGKSENSTSLFRRSIRSLTLNDFSYIKQVDGQIRLKELKSACMENWNWEIGSAKKIMQEIANKLKNWEEFGAKNRQAITDELSMHQEKNPTKVNQNSDSGIDPASGSSSGGQPPYYSESQKLAVLRFWIAAWYTKLYGYLVLQETFWNDHLLNKDYPLQSSTIQRIWHHPLRNCCLVLPELQGFVREKVKWTENRWIRWFLYTISKVEVVFWITLVALVPTVVGWIIREFRFRKCI